ncbi:MAG: hypothetical protein QGG00_01035 [Verrucomicrobiota bacterium]|nr:hypothetical protein [Verrucomicrobiota bacterium]
MKGSLFLLSVVTVLAGCGDASSEDESAAADAPKPVQPANVTVTPVAKGDSPGQQVQQSGKLTLGQQSKESQPEAKPVPSPKSAVAPQSSGTVDPKESAAPVRVEGEGSFTRENGQYLAGGTPFDGQFVDHHDSGNKSVEGTFVDGKQQGVWTYYHENGQRYRTGNYVNGRADGQWVIWREDGSKWSEQTYINGQLNGVETRWHPNGQKQSESTWQGGKTISKQEWDERGMPRQ